MNLEEIPAKTIITRTKSAEWFGADYNMNIYRGCSHGCIYCDSRSDCYENTDFDRVKVKANALGIIESELRKKTKTGVVATGAMSDPYNPYEKELELTRRSLGLLDAHNFGVAIDTKSDLVARDADILSAIRAHSPVIVKLTVTTGDEALCAKLEPHAPPVSRRFGALRLLAGRGLFCGVLMLPLLPYVNDTEENILSILRGARENGAKFVYPSFGVTMRSGQREYFLDRLETARPGYSDKYRRAFGGSYYCPSENAERLWEVFSSECGRLGLFYRMKDIVAGYKAPYETTQLSLFP